MSVQNPFSDWFQDSVLVHGNAVARDWLRRNGFELERVPSLDTFRPAAYGKKRLEGAAGVFETIAVVEVGASVGTAEAQDRMHESAEWRKARPGRRSVLFVPRGSIKEAAETLADYDGMVVY